MRRDARLDANHGEIVAAFERHGFSVLSLAGMGKGVPDVLLTRAGKLLLVEIKDGSKSPSRQRLTPDQRDFHAIWPVSVVRSVDDVTRISTYAARVGARNRAR